MKTPKLQLPTKQTQVQYQTRLVVLCEQLEDADNAGEEEEKAAFVKMIIETVRECIEKGE